MKIRSPKILVLFLLIVLYPRLSQASALEADFSGSAHFLVLTKLRRAFTFDQLGKAELTLAIENGLLSKALEQQAAGDATQAESSLADFAKEQSTLQNLIGLQTPSRHFHHLVSDLVNDQTIQLSLLSSFPSTNSQAQDLATRAPKALNQTLALPALTSDEVSIAVAEATSAAAKGAESTQDKIAKKVRLKNSLQDSSESSVVKAALQTAEDAQVGEAVMLTTPSLTQLISTLQEKEIPRHNLPLLQKLLAEVPEPTKPSIETALEHESSAEAKTIDSNQDEIAALNTIQEPSHILSAVLERVKGKTLKPAAKETLAKDLVVTQEKLLKAQEDPQKESNKTSDLHLKAKPEVKPSVSPTPHSEASHTPSVSGKSALPKKSNDTTEHSPSEPSPTSLPHTPEPTDTPTQPSASPEIHQSNASIRLRNGLLDPSSATVDVNSRLSLQFENDDPTPSILTLSNGLHSESVSNQGKTLLQPFIITGPITFSITVNGATVTGTITTR